MRLSAAPLLLLLGLALTASVLFAVVQGSMDTGALDVWRAITGQSEPVTRDVVINLRLPRVLSAAGTGACLALAGAFMQVLLRNPLADPYILGTSGGAAAMALLALLAGFGGWAIDGAAFGGALASTGLVFALSSAGGRVPPDRLLLTGVVTASGWAALVSLMLALAPEASMKGMLFWLMGDFGFAQDPLPVLVACGAGLILGAGLAPILNVLSAGEEQAALLGIGVNRARVAIFSMASLLTAVAVTTAGTVGFVGLVVPHLIRLVAGADNRLVVPASALGGATLMVLADTLARTALAPRQLPVGAVTALVGVPIFLLLMRRTMRDVR